MSMTAKSPAAPAPQARIQSLLNYRLLFGAILAMSLLWTCARLYQQFFAWSTGLDSTTPEFQTHWMRLFYTEIVLEGLAAVSLWGWLWRTRDRDVESVKPREELRRYFRLVGWLLMYVLAVYWTVFFAEQDATWHQTVVRDTEFTPSHIVLFFGAMPVFIITGVGAYLYARTRIPLFARGHSLPFLMAVAGPFLMLPNVAFNEWGHTFWIMEEIFSAPLHAGFVIFGWNALCLGGILMQGIPRISELIAEEARTVARSSAAA